MNTAGLYNTVGPIYPLYKTIFIKICWLTFSSLLCNFTVLLYFVPFLPFSTLTSSLSITSVSLSLSLLFPPLPLPLTPPHLPRLYNIRITAAGAAASSLLPPLPSPPHAQPLSQSSVTTGRSMEEVRRVMGLSNSPTRRQARTAYGCVFCMCVTNRNPPFVVCVCVCVCVWICSLHYSVELSGC